MEVKSDGEEGRRNTYMHIDSINNPYRTSDEPHPNPSRQNLRKTIEPDDVTECAAGRGFEGEVGGEGGARGFAVVEEVVGVVYGRGA